MQTWSTDFSRPRAQDVFFLSWSPVSTQLAGFTCKNGNPVLSLEPHISHAKLGILGPSAGVLCLKVGVWAHLVGFIC